MKKFILFFIFFCSCMLPLASHAQQAPAQQPSTLQQKVLNSLPSDDFQQPNVVFKLAVLAGVTLLPFAVLLLTSFVKIIVVLSLLRNAIGVQQTPPNQVINGIALLMTIYVMFPTAMNMYKSAESAIAKSPPEIFSGQTALYLVNVIDEAKEPLRSFLKKNCMAQHMKSFYQLAYRVFPEEYRSSMKPDDFIILIPSFISSQLKMAFEIGVLIYLPFFVIDLVTSNILLAMGMMMLSPLTIALPIKLLLLVIIDGWTILLQGLVLTFK